jgi:hypothetical protein
MAADERKFAALGQDWTARFDFNSICALEERYDRPFLDLVAPFMASVELNDDGEPDEASAVAAASKIKFSDLRAIFHQSLLSHQPATSAEDAGSVIADMGLDAAMHIITWAIMVAMPAPKADAGNGKKAR